MYSDVVVTRRQAPIVLADLGVVVSYGTLGTLAYYDAGPPFVRRGQNCLYRYEDLAAFAEARKTRRKRHKPVPAGDA